MTKLLAKTKSLFSSERLVSILSIPILILLFLTNSAHIISQFNFIIAILVILLANILVELHFIKVKLNNK